MTRTPRTRRPSDHVVSCRDLRVAICVLCGWCGSSSNALTRSHNVTGRVAQPSPQRDRVATTTVLLLERARTKPAVAESARSRGGEPSHTERLRATSQRASPCCVGRPSKRRTNWPPRQFGHCQPGPHRLSRISSGRRRHIERRATRTQTDRNRHGNQADSVDVVATLKQVGFAITPREPVVRRGPRPLRFLGREW